MTFLILSHPRIMTLNIHNSMMSSSDAERFRRKKITFASRHHRYLLMKRTILALIFIFSCIAFTPLQVMGAPAIEVIDNDVQTINISVSESTLHITGGNGQTLHIYNVTGVRVMSIRVDGMDKRYELNLPKGCYIVKVGNVVRKISLR